MPFPRQPGFMASFPLQTQMLLPQVPALVETETVATVGAGTSCYTGTPGDDDTSASRMTTPNVLSITAQTLPATRKYPSNYQRPPEPCQAASASPRSAKAGGRGKQGAQPRVLSIMDSAPSSSCIPSTEHLCPAPRFILHQQSPLHAPEGRDTSTLLPQLAPAVGDPSCCGAQSKTVLFQRGGGKPACCDYQIQQLSLKSSRRTWQSLPGLCSVNQPIAPSGMRLCPLLFLPPAATLASKGFPCAGQGDDLLCSRAACSEHRWHSSL